MCKFKFSSFQKWLMLITVTFNYSGAAMAQPKRYQCEIDGKQIILATNPSLSDSEVFKNCSNVQDVQSLAVPHRPPEPRPLEWPIVLMREPLNDDLQLQKSKLLNFSVPLELAEKISYHAERAGLPYKLVHTLIAAESAFKPLALSPKGARGLMQIMPETAREYGVNDPQTLYDTDENLRVGTTLLKRLINKFDNDLDLALAAYNAGEGAVMRCGRCIPPYPETQNYVQKIKAALEN